MSAAVGISGDDDNDSFSSDSDDEFLLMQQSKGGAAGSADREALVRKKLLESFYGTSAVNDRDQRLPDTGRDIADDEDDDDDDDDDEDGPPGLSARVISGQTEDLDSPNFDAKAHTQKHVFSSSIHPLLETEESLACQVRTLDSTLQTLVYENYSRFIDATEAIRNIDVSVQAHHQNLQSLEQNISSAAEISRSMEATVGPLRDQIVEKLRVRRLLQRLETLLKLPSTLRQQIQRGKYRWAAQSYLSAYSILSKHSQGFESLQRIESECKDIIQSLMIQVRRKLIHWSGGLLALEDEEDGNISKQDDDPLDGETLPDPPQSVADIIECAATPPLMLAQDPPLFNNTRISKEDCQEMALTATLRLLERYLDAHHIEVQSLQKQQKSTPMAPSPLGTLGEPTLLPGEDGGSVSPAGVPVNTGHHLIPTQVLDSILEACTLYSLSFVGSSESGLDQGDDAKPTTHDERLAQFISTAFNSFLQHVRGEFLDLIMWHQQQQAKKAHERGTSAISSADAPAVAPGEDDDSSDIAYEQISAAMSTLVVSVRQLASGLSLPEVLVSADFASSLVDQTIGLTEAMVRRQVDQKFYSLRMRVVQDCLTPFCQKVVVSPSSEKDAEQPRLLESVQLASVALSDSLQLVDDTVRSMLVTTTPEEAELEESLSLSGAEKDDTMLKDAVHLSTKRFATWLASALELLAGCESSDPRLMLQVPKLTSAGTAETPGASFRNGDIPSGESGLLSEGTSSDRTNVETALRNLHNSTEPTLNMILALAEMCRVAERIVAENINQLIGVHGGATGGKQRKVSVNKGGLFSEDGKNNAANNPISDRFRLAASRVLNLYASTQGTEAAALLCQSLGTPNTQHDEVELIGPSAAVCKTLEIAKSICRDSADLFGGDLSAGPVPDSLDDEYASLTAMARRGANRQGLVLDVERMFLEKVAVFPHPNDFQEFRQTTVLSLFFRVTFKALAEYMRFVQLSLQGYHQLVVDTEFLKWFLPHYIKDEVLRDGTNVHSSLESLLLEAAQTGRSRCLEANKIEEDVTERNRARAAIRRYMDENDVDALPFVI